MIASTGDMDNLANESSTGEAFGALSISPRERASPQNEAGDCPKKQTPPAAADTLASSPRSGHIRFHDQVQIIEYIPTRSDLLESEKQMVWWGPNDYFEFQATAEGISTAAQGNRRMTVGLDEAYRMAEELAKISDDEDLLELEFQKLPVQSQRFKGLAQWCTHGHTRRGLEKAVSRRHCNFRRSLMRKANEDVCNLQTLSPPELRIEAEKRSRVARIFARMMGEADAMAARHKGNVMMRRWSGQGPFNRESNDEDFPHDSPGAYQRSMSLPGSSDPSFR